MLVPQLKVAKFSVQRGRVKIHMNNRNFDKQKVTVSIKTQ